MEHVVQFGINIDDDAISKAIEGSAKRQIIDELKAEVRDYLGVTGKRDYYGNMRFEYKHLVDDIKRELEAELRDRMKDQIFGELVEKMSKNTVRQKWFKEAMLKVLPDIMEDAVGEGR